MSAVRLVLASASTARRALMKEAGFRFEVRSAPESVEAAALDAVRAKGGSPEELVLAAARAKAAAVAGETGAASGGRTVVIGADTVVVASDGSVLGKGHDDAESAAILRKLVGTRHRVLTGVVLTSASDGQRREFTASTITAMGRMSDAEIAAYVASGHANGAAGAYRIQEGGTDQFVRVISGSFSNVVGLPMEEIIRELAAMGVHPAAQG